MVNKKLIYMKFDLIESLRNDKYYAEMELTRLLNQDNYSYKDRIELIKETLKDVVLIDSSISLIEQIFTKPKNKDVDDGNNE